MTNNNTDLSRTTQYDKNRTFQYTEDKLTPSGFKVIGPNFKTWDQMNDLGYSDQVLDQVVKGDEFHGAIADGIWAHITVEDDDLF